jgi:hypothetical protein
MRCKFTANSPEEALDVLTTAPASSSRVASASLLAALAMIKAV